MAEIITFSPAPSIFGNGALEKLPVQLQMKGWKRLLIVTDPQMASSAIFQRVRNLLRSPFAVEIFDQTPTEPHSSDVDQKKDALRKDFDCLLALGGGSPMDFAKALAIVMTHGGSLGDYEGEGLVPGPVLPVVCVPTTSGTGSQNTQTTVFTHRGVKSGCSSEYIRPALSIVDPELTLTLPKEVTRNSGYDALMHSIESFLARPFREVKERPILYQGGNAFSRPLALEAFRSIWSSYREAVAHGQNREARWHMSLGSHLAGLAFSHSGLGLVHALASSLGGMIDAPHGVCLAACTVIGLGYNFPSCERDLALLGSVSEEIDRGALSRVSAELFLAKIQKLIKDLGFPTRPGELGIQKKDARILYEKTLGQTRRIQTNPRPLDEELLSHIEKGI